MLGDAEAVVDCRVRCAGIEPRRRADGRGRHAGDRLGGFRRIAQGGDEVAPFAERIELATRADVFLLDQAFGHHDVRERVDDRDVGARAQLQVMGGRDVGRAYQADDARIDDDQLRALTQPALQLRGEHRVPLGRVGTDQQHDVGPHDRGERLRTSRLPSVCFSP